MLLYRESNINSEIEKAYKRLANSIVIFAIKDYIYALNHFKVNKVRELDEFFRSDWCKKLCCVKGEDIINKLKHSTDEERTAINELLSV